MTNVGAAPGDAAGRPPRRVRRRAALVLVAAAAVAGNGCARRAVPARPPLPAVNFVRPNDPNAVVGLTGAGVENLKRRDAAWRDYAERLEATIRGGR